MCYVRNYFIFSGFLKEESEISVQEDFGHVSYTQISESEKSDSLLTAGNKIGLDKKSLQIQAKSCDFILNPACVETC